MATIDDQTRAIWTPRLWSALRTTLACSIVGTMTLYSPTSVRKFMPYPSFSYITTILIVSDANVGDTLRGAWHVLYATLQVMLLSVLSLWLVRPERFNPGLAATAVAICSFIVAAPESTRLMSKRIAFGQIVIVYVGTVVQGAKTPVVMHPVHVALSTGLGAVASVLALSFPYPRFACSQIKQYCRDYTQNVVSRLNLYTNALSSNNSSSASELISQAMSYSEVGDKLLQTLKSNEEGMLWERPDIRFLRPYFYLNPSERLQEIELPLKGMQMALESCSSFPIPILDEDIRQILTTMNGFIAKKLEQTKCIVPLDITTLSETKHSSQDSIQTLKRIPSSVQDLSAMFYLFCMDLLRRDNRDTQINTEDQNLKWNSNDSRESRNCGNLWKKLRLSNHSLLFAFKCSITLGFAVLFGLLYDKKNGYWSGLTIAISFVTGKQPIFTVANARVQGTAIGSVYGVLGCFIFKNLFHLRLLPLIPWIMFASLLRHSRLYGEAGSIAASIGALLILGRTNYTTPTEFAIARLTEASIGLFCFVGGEILFQPSRAATLARTELSRIFGTLGESMLNFPSMDERFKLGLLQSQITSFEEYTRQAELEPNFWFHKFPTSCYLDLLHKMKKVSNLLQFLTSETDFLTETCPKIGLLWKDLLQEPLVKDELELFKEKVVSSFKCLEKVISVNSLVKLDKDLRNKKNIIHDIEIGDSSKSAMETASLKEDLEKISNSLLLQLIKMIEKVYSHEGDDELKRQVVLCIGGLGFCIDKLMRETIAIEKTVKEVVQRQNPLCLVKLSQIACKVDASRD